MNEQQQSPMEQAEGRGAAVMLQRQTHRWQRAAAAHGRAHLQRIGNDTFGWNKGRALCPALPDMLGLRHWMAEKDIAKPQKTHAIQVEVYLQSKSIVYSRRKSPG